MTLDSTARSIFQAAIDEERCGELLSALFDGGSATVDAVTGRLVIATADQLVELQEPLEVPEFVRRSGAKNIASPDLQSAFIEGARQALGAPSKQDAEALLGRRVLLTFNAETRGLIQMRGILTSVIDHPAGGSASVTLVLDDNKNTTYPLNMIQSIKVVP